MISERTKMLGSLDAVHTHTHTPIFLQKELVDSLERETLYSTWKPSTRPHTNILTKELVDSLERDVFFIQHGNFLHYKVI